MARKWKLDFLIKQVFWTDSHIFQSILTKFGDWMEGEVMEGGGGWSKAAEGGKRRQMVAKGGEMEGDEFYGFFFYGDSHLYCKNKCTSVFTSSNKTFN